MTLSRETLETHRKICERFEGIYHTVEFKGAMDRTSRMMDLEAVADRMDIDWAAMLAAPEEDFLHDVEGIHHHICRESGELGHYFLPRFAR